MNRRLFPYFLFLLMIIPALSFANGGDQRVIDGKYLINLSRAPFTPRVNTKTSMLASFFDIQKNKLIAEDLIVKVRIAKLGGGQGKREFLFEKDNIAVKGGVLEFSYTFTDSGLHEVFFDFAFASDPQESYEAPDFLVDVQKQEVESQRNPLALLVVLASMAGLVIGFVVGRLK